MKRRLVVAIAVLLAAVLVWLMWPRGPRIRLKLDLEAARTRTLRGGTVGLKVIPHAIGGKLGDVAPIHYRWTANAGQFEDAEAAETTFIAPQRVADVTVSVTARYANGGSASAAVIIKVEDLPSPVAGSASPGLGVDAALPGYSVPEVTFDKPSLCANDDVLVHVKATDPLGDDRWLEPRLNLGGSVTSGYTMVSRAGSALIDEAEATGLKFGPQKAVIDIWDARSQSIVATRVLPFVIDNCSTPGAGVKLSCALGQFTHDEVRCTATVDDTVAVTGVDWEFGYDPEGKRPPLGKASSPQGFVAFERPVVIEDRLVSTMLVRATVHHSDGDGKDLVGRASITSPSVAWEAAAMGGPLVLFAIPRLGPSPPGTTIKRHFTMNNPFNEAIVISSIERRRVKCDAEAGTVEGTVSPQTRPGKSIIAAGERLEFDWEEPIDLGICAYEEQFTGEGQKSHREAKGTWTLLTQNTRTLSAHDTGRVQRALEILGTRRGSPVTSVTEQELHELEEQGLILPAQETPEQLEARPPTEAPPGLPGTQPEQ